MNIFETYIRKIDQTFPVDWDELPAESQAYVIAYGLKQSLSDSAAGAKTQAEAEALVHKRLDGLKAGTVGLRAAGEPVDPVAKEALSLAKSLLRKKFGRALPKDTLEAKALEFSRDPRLLAKAEVIIAERARQKEGLADLLDGVVLTGA